MMPGRADGEPQVGHDSVHRLTQWYRAFPSASLPPVAAAPTFRHLGRLTAKNHVISQTSFSLASNFPGLRFSLTCSLWSLSTLSLVSFTPLFPPGCALPQLLTHLFLRLLQKWVSLGEMLRRRTHITLHAIPNPLCLAPSLLPPGQLTLHFPSPMPLSLLICLLSP